MAEFTEPLFIPVMVEMFSKMLVISAEHNFECSKPKLNQKKKTILTFSKQLNDANLDHKKTCKQWRAAGRPSDNLHPMKIKKLQSQRLLQKISRDEQSSKAIDQHNELMETHENDIGQVCRKLKKFVEQIQEVQKYHL